MNGNYTNGVIDGGNINQNFRKITILKKTKSHKIIRTYELRAGNLIIG